MQGSRRRCSVAVATALRTVMAYLLTYLLGLVSVAKNATNVKLLSIWNKYVFSLLSNTHISGDLDALRPIG